MSLRLILTMVLMMGGLLLTACQTQEVPPIQYDPQSLRFSGDRAMQIEADFVTRFPYRHSGQPNNRLAALWISERMTAVGLSCAIDDWSIYNYSRNVPLNNVVCILPGESRREILLVAHLDQSPITIQGADDDGSGIAILLHLAEIFAAEKGNPYTMIFLASDSEEYGMNGVQRYINTHSNPEDIIAGLSLDSVGLALYDGMAMEMNGQFRQYAPIWLALTAREAARAANLEWDVILRAPLDQVTDQAAPISFMDQGPIVAAGVPALGFAGHKPPESADLYYQLWHDPGDTLDVVSPFALGQSGLIAEALIRQLTTMTDFPNESGAYLYFDNTRQVLRGAPLWAIFIGFVCIFLLGSMLADRRSPLEKVRGWKNAMPHFLGLWLPLLASIVLLYGFVAMGLMHSYDTYPATTKDPDLLHPRWPAVILFLLGLGLFLWLGRSIVRRFAAHTTRPEEIRSLALFVITLGSIYLLAINPFSLLFLVPALFWLLIRSRKGVGRVLDILFFLLGGLVVYALVYTFGFLTLHYDWAFLWYLMNMFSIRMIGFPTAIMITAVVAAGLTLIVDPVRMPEAAKHLVRRMTFAHQSK